MTSTPPERSARMDPAIRARRFYAAERYIQRLVESAPPLTDEQRTRLAALLTEGKATR